MLVADVARVCHEVIRAYSQGLKDFSQAPWEDAPQWQRDSAVNGVNFHLENPDASPSASHESWLKEKIDSGWKYGPVKNPDTKEHPCCVPYDQLPVEQRAKDYIFSSIVRELAAEIEVA